MPKTLLTKSCDGNAYTIEVKKVGIKPSAFRRSCHPGTPVYYVVGSICLRQGSPNQSKPSQFQGTAYLACGRSPQGRGSSLLRGASNCR